MAMNTPYLTADTSAQSRLNTPYISTGATAISSDVSSTGTLFVGGNALMRSNTSMVGFADVSLGTQATLLSFHTTASATSVIVPDQGFGIYFHSGNSCRIVFRSGVTTYTWIATTGAVL